MVKASMPSLGGKAFGSFDIVPLYIGMIVGWVVFGSLNELRNAKKSGGCCESECGTGTFDKISWGTTLGIAVFSTVIIGLPWVIYIVRALIEMIGSLL